MGSSIYQALSSNAFRNEPRLLIFMSSYDVVSTIHQSLPDVHLPAQLQDIRPGFRLADQLQWDAVCACELLRHVLARLPVPPRSGADTRTLSGLT